MFFSTEAMSPGLAQVEDEEKLGKLTSPAAEGDSVVLGLWPFTSDSTNNLPSILSIMKLASSNKFPGLE